MKIIKPAPKLDGRHEAGRRIMLADWQKKAGADGALIVNAFKQEVRPALRRFLDRLYRMRRPRRRFRAPHLRADDRPSVGRQLACAPARSTTWWPGAARPPRSSPWRMPSSTATSCA
jgi:hypothetical protein